MTRLCVYSRYVLILPCFLKICRIGLCCSCCNTLEMSSTRASLIIHFKCCGIYQGFGSNFAYDKQGNVQNVTCSLQILWTTADFFGLNSHSVYGGCIELWFGRLDKYYIFLCAPGCGAGEVSTGREPVRTGSAVGPDKAGQGSW